jgi:hypothetical protein
MFQLLLRRAVRPGRLLQHPHQHHYYNHSGHGRRRRHGPEWHIAALSLVGAVATASAASSSLEEGDRRPVSGSSAITSTCATSCFCEASRNDCSTLRKTSHPPPTSGAALLATTKKEEEKKSVPSDDTSTRTKSTSPTTTAAAAVPTATSAALTTNEDSDDNETSSGSGSASGSSSTGNFCLHEVYDIEQVLGEGAYGMVYQARRKLDGVLVALKTMPRNLTGKTDFEREVAALQLLAKAGSTTTGSAGAGSSSSGTPHPHIVQFKDLHRDETNYYLAMELIEGGELLEHLIDNGPYSEALAASFLRQFAEAICFVHANNLCHADLKPENLLLSSNDVTTAKLIVADFGCARSHDYSRQEMHLPAQEFAIGCSFLHMVALGNQFELERMLQERPSLVNFRDYDFRTPLHCKL